MTSPRKNEFVVEEIFEIKGRGPCIVRSEEAASSGPAGACPPGRGEPGCFEPGEWLVCGSLRAQIRGIEYWAIPGPQPQRALLLSIDRQLVEVGQVWRRPPDTCRAVLYMWDSEWYHKGDCTLEPDHEGRHNDGMYTWSEGADDADPVDPRSTRVRPNRP